MYDLCVVGHVTRDRIEVAGWPGRVQPGGTAYYSSLTAARLGLRAIAITMLRPVDRPLLLEEMCAAGITVRAFDSPRTTEYVNSFSGGDVETRRQRVLAVADPFRPEHIDAEAAAVYLFGPLTHLDFSSQCIDRAASAGAVVAMDVQGLLRHVRRSHVELMRSDAAIRMLRHVDILKAGREEAMLLTAERTVEASARALAACGPREVLVTSGGAGSHVLAGDVLTRIPAYAPPEVIDTTGCGDTYLAAYVACRCRGGSPEEAGHAASRVAGAKTSAHGAYRGNVDGVPPALQEQLSRSTAPKNRQVARRPA